MKRLITLLSACGVLLALTLPVTAAVFGGGGGSTGAQGPPGSATNAIDKTTGHGTNTSFHGSVTNNGTLRQVGASDFRGAVTVTNGAVNIGQEGFPITFGNVDGSVDPGGWLMTNRYSMFMTADITLTGPGTGLNFDVAGTQARFRTGTLLQMDSGSRLELDYLTSDRVMITGAGGMATNSDMRLAASLSGASDGQVLAFHNASGTWTNTPAGSGTPGGNTTDIQFNQGGAFAGTNSFTFDRTNNRVGINIPGRRPNADIEIGGSAPAIRLGSAGDSNEVTSAGMRTSVGTISLSPRVVPAVGAGMTLVIDTNRVAAGATDSMDLTNFRSLYLLRDARVGSVISTGAVQTAGVLVTNPVPGSYPSAIDLKSTNGANKATIQGAHEMSFDQLLIVGVLEKAAASVVEFPYDRVSELMVTNPITAAITVVGTNGVAGRKGRFKIRADGTDRVFNYVPNTGQLVANMNSTNTAMATSYSETIMAGFDLEGDVAIDKIQGTNTHYLVTRQSKR